MFPDKLRFRSFRFAAAIGIAVVGLAVAGCGGDDDEGEAAETAAAPAETMEAETGATAAEMNIVETAVAAGDFTTLVQLVQDAGLAETLSEGGPFTVFAPTDAAFAEVPQETLDALAADPEQLEAVLLYHVVEGEVLAADAAGLDSAETLNGASIDISSDNGGVTVNDATVVTADVQASNGVIHAIDAVLLPPS